MTENRCRPAAEIDELALALLAAWDERRQIEPLSQRATGLSLDVAYRITARIRALREARGERPIGRKIGFTNRTIWAEYQVYAPIWGYMYDTTCQELAGSRSAFPLTLALEPRIEPEIAFHFHKAPHPEMDERELLECIDWIAHGFEVVLSLYKGWAFSAADTVAGFGLHGCYFLGPRQELAAKGDAWFRQLSNFEIDLNRGSDLMDTGHGRNVLGGPLCALRHLIGLLHNSNANPPLAAGEIVTTGTLTRALTVYPGETWSTAFRGLDLNGIEISFSG